MQGWLNTNKLINAMYHSSKLKIIHGHLFRCRKGIWDTLGKISEEITDAAQHNKGSLDRGYRQHQCKWGES